MTSKSRLFDFDVIGSRAGQKAQKAGSFFFSGTYGLTTIWYYVKYPLLVVLHQYDKLHIGVHIPRRRFLEAGHGVRDNSEGT
jgi:hypothetical protein